MSQFLSLYPRRDRYIQRLPGRDWGWLDGPLLDYQIAGVISDEGRRLHRGCAWAHKTRFAVLDIDKNSKYKNALELQKLVTRLAAIGLTAKLYQSSNSTGWHLYLFFDDWADSDEVQASLRAWLVANGYKIAGGTLEVFPSGNGLRLPLQQGFAWLELDGTIKIRREEIKENEAIALFLTDLKENKRNWSAAKNLIETQLQAIATDQGERDQAHEERLNTDDFEPFYWRGIDWEKYQRGLRYWQDGLTGRNQRHDAVLCIGHYLWYGDVANNIRARPYPSKANERAELISAWLREKHNGHSSAVNSGRWTEIEQDIERACSWIAESSQKIKLEPYPITDRLIDRLAVVPYLIPDDLKLANERREQVARKKIKDALDEMLGQGQHPTIRNLAKASGCERRTIKKHREIWALYTVRIETKLSTGVGDHSGGAGGAFPDSLFSLVPGFDSSGSLCSELEEKDLSRSDVQESLLIPDAASQSALSTDSAVQSFELGLAAISTNLKFVQLHFSLFLDRTVTTFRKPVEQLAFKNSPIVPDCRSG